MPPRERHVLDALPFTVYKVDLDGRITYMNRSSTRFAQTNGSPSLGEEDAVVGVPIWDAIADVATRDQIEQAMATLREGRAPSLAWEFSRSSPAEERVVPHAGECDRRGTLPSRDSRSRRWTSRRATAGARCSSNTGMALAPQQTASTECSMRSRSSFAARWPATPSPSHSPTVETRSIAGPMHQARLRCPPPDLIADALRPPPGIEALQPRTQAWRARRTRGIEITAPMTSGERGVRRDHADLPSPFPFAPNRGSASRARDHRRSRRRRPWNACAS